MEKTKFHVNIFPDVSFSSDSLQPNIRPPVGGGEDAHRGRVVRDEAADVVVGEAAVGVRGAAAASTQVHSVTILVKLMIKPGEMENNSFSNDSAIQLYITKSYNACCTHFKIHVQYSIQSQLKWEW